MATRRTFSGGNLRTRRKAAGIYQGTLADKIGVALCSVSNWETGRCQPKPETLLDLADVLGCKVGDLFEVVAE